MWRLTARNAGRFAVHRVRRRFAPHHQRTELDDAFSLRTADDVARELGNMKGALMKAGQLLGFVVEALPDTAQQSLAQLYSDAPPMSADLAAGVVRDAFGRDPDHLFLDWQPQPAAAASIGQVHRAVTRDGREVAVKVQYPGVGRAIEADLANADVLYRLISSFTLKGLDTRALVDELRGRMRDELDYRIEAANLRELGQAFAGHPFVRLPALVEDWSAETVITTEWVDGLSWQEFLAQASPDARQLAGESIWRFAQHAILRLGVFNGDPHPGNYRFSPDGHVTFLDFGMVKRWAPGEWERLAPCMDAIIVERDPAMLVTAMEASGFLRPGHGLDPQAVYDYVSSPYRPYLTDRFRFTRDFMRDTVARIIDVNGPHAEVIAHVDMPPSFVMLDRVVWGVSAILGKLELEAPWRAMLLEYRIDAPPATALGRAELAWRGGSAH
ncbi:MAG: AarF/ABC1/UbiB kinase family protein [Acidimicrobiales bacterium]|nr:AarF/ABC1/UbiB kinase family protein [Acidimicrobiales bacterium]